MKLQLHIGELVIYGCSYDALHDVAIRQDNPYEIYLIKESKLHKVPHPKELPDLSQETKALRPKYRKLSENDIIDAIRLLEKGYEKELVRKKYHVGIDYLNAAIKEFNLRNQFAV